jgi:hypothetical protein
VVLVIRSDFEEVKGESVTVRSQGAYSVRGDGLVRF